MDKIGNYKVAYVDWKEESEEILFALSEVFSLEIPELKSETMEELAKNYAMEQTLDAIKALGQEISTTSHLLYEIDDDSDSYVLTIIEEGQEDAFLEEMKSLKKKTKRMLQPRKKPGSPAKRIDFGKQLKGTVIKAEAGDYMILQSGCKGVYIAHSRFGSDTAVESKVLSFDPQVNVICQSSKLVNHIAGREGRYAAVLLNPERKSASSGLTDKNTYISVGEKLSNISDWKIIGSIGDDNSLLRECIWFGNDLFVTGYDQIYVFRNAMNSENSTPAVYTITSNRGFTPVLFTVAGKLFVVTGGQILQWCERSFLKKEGFNKCIFKMEITFTSINQVHVLNDREVVFQVPKQYPRSGEVQMMDVIVLNVDTGSARTISCFQGNLHSLGRGKVVNVCFGHDMVDDKKKLPLMVIMDFVTGQSRTLPYGCLGAAELQDIYLTTDNRILLDTGRKIICPENLNDFLVYYSV